MEDEKKLYPFRFCTVEDIFDWGTDNFKLADLGYRDTFIKEGWLAGNAMSEIMDMYMDRVVGDNIFAHYGRQFPFQIKTLNVNGRMPLRVHPDDETAQQRYDLLGKEKLWYIAQASEGAGIFLGLKLDSDASELCRKCADNSVDGILNRINVKAGDHFHIPPGEMHAADGKMTIIEISESSPLDFCLCGWGRDVSEEEFDTALGLTEALDFINFRKHSDKDGCCHHHGDMIHKLIQIPQFTSSLIRLGDPLHIYSEQLDSCISYSCVSGSASIQIEAEGIGTVSYRVTEGETILVPAEIPDFILAPAELGTVLIETLLDKREDPDPYINPDTQAELYDDDDEDDECDCHGHDCDHNHKHYS